MGSIIGDKLKVSVFGESHGPAIGIVIDGLPAGCEIDMERIQRELSRRAPGKSKISTARKESDIPKILSGIFNGRTTGAPLSAVIENTNTKSGDYSEIMIKPRPGHSDYPAMVKYDGFNDYRGGGHFSGRLTALLVFAGAICKGILEEKGIYIGAHIKSIGTVKDQEFSYTSVSQELLKGLAKESIPVVDKTKAEAMEEEILKAREKQDSVGGVIEGIIINMPPGIGNPMFDSVESKLSHMLFSIPAVKGVEFGDGFNISSMTGSEARDEYYIEDNKVKAYTNHNGGILGGITTGMPVVFSVSVKPTASIGIEQRTINTREWKDDIIAIKGRHDPCIVPRAVPVVEAVAAITIMDLMI